MAPHGADTGFRHNRTIDQVLDWSASSSAVGLLMQVRNMVVTGGVCSALLFTRANDSGVGKKRERGTICLS
jgi:hypothetical protein